MGKIETDHTGSGGGITLSSDGTQTLQTVASRLKSLALLQQTFGG